MRRRLTLGISLVLMLAGLVVGVLAILADRNDDSDNAITQMVELAAEQTNTTAAPEFPAIVDSAIRDPDEREEPSSASLNTLETIAHSTSAFTQGFELFDGRLFESTGLVGESTLREVDPATGAVLRSTDIDGVFAEGITVVGDEIVMLTFKEGLAFRYDLESFELTGTHTYEGQGWGLCYDDQRLIMSDGSPSLFFRDPESFDLLDSVLVTYNGAPVQRINELECVNGKVWANIWKTPLIIEIDPGTGRVLTVIDARDFRPDSTLNDIGSVLNGIAYDPADDTFLITGKRWPTMYRVELVR